VEKDKQDSALSDLSNVLGQLKGMALDMGSEIDRYVLHRLYHNLFHWPIGMRIQPESRTQAK
jgi:synaptosomal-associated protein 25